MRVPIPCLGPLGTAILFLLLLPLARALYRDEAYQIDFQHALLGAPLPDNTFFHAPDAASKASLLYTLSDQLVLGAVNPKDGALVWRHDLAERPDDRRAARGLLRAASGSGAVVSAAKDSVRAWDAASGRLLWEWVGKGAVRSLEVLDRTGAPKDVLAMTQVGDANGAPKVTRLSAEDGSVVWEVEQSIGEKPIVVTSSPDSIFYISLVPSTLRGYKIKVTTLKADTGKQLSQVQLSTESEVDSEASIIHVGSRSAGPMIVWADATRKHIKANVLGKKSVGLLSAPTREDLRDISIHSVRSEKSPGHFLVKFQTEKYSHVEVYNVDGKSGTFRKAYNLPLLKGKAAFSASLVDGNVLFTKNTPSEATLYSSSSPDPLEQWTPRSNHTEGSEPEEMIQAVSEVVPKAGSKYAVRSALVRTSGDWEVVQNGEPLWVRNEGLAGVVSAAWAEIPRQESLVQELEVESHTNIAAAYIHRVKRHISDLEHLPNWLRSIPKRIITSFTGQSLGQEFDGFGFSKLIIAATEKGRVIAIESGKQGQVRWNVKATTLDGGAVWNVTDIVVENGLAIITATGGEYVSLELESGKVREKQARGLLPNVFKLAFVTSSNGKRLTLPLSEEGQPVDPLTEDAGSSTYIVTQGSDGSVRGWHLVGGKSPISSWTFRPPPGETISAVTSRPAHDPVASIGRALGDRNVLYKFLSPNLILVITTSSSRASATAYLLDSITGRTLHTTTHNAIDTSQPIAATFSENWFAYTLASDPALAPPHLTATTPKAPLLAIAELYESPIPNDRGPLSAAPNTSSIHSPLHAPHVLAATHVLPAPLAALATTATLQGITPRTLLAYCPPLAAVYALPYHPLSPRRPVGRDATADEREEGLLPYAAPLELFAHWSLSHRREVLGIARIVAEPTRMESSSLVLAYGALDLFATREAPIGAFDVLGSGFGRWSLVLTVVGLAAGTAVLAPMVRKKQVTSFWGG